MTKRFIVAASPLTVQQSKLISDYFRGRCRWWHWIESLWLVVDENDAFTVQQIRDDLNLLVPKVNKIVLEVEPRTWSGFGPKSEKRNMFLWLKKVWVRDDDAALKSEGKSP